MASVSDILGLSHTAVTNALAAFTALKRQINTYRAVTELLGAADSKLKRIQSSIASLQVLFGVSILEHQFYLQTLADIREVENNLLKTQDECDSKTKMKEIIASSRLNDELKLVYGTLYDIDRQLAIVSMIGDVVLRKLETDSVAIHHELGKSIEDKLSEIADLMSRLFKSLRGHVIGTSVSEPFNSEESLSLTGISSFPPLLELPAAEQKANVLFLLGRIYYEGDHKKRKDLRRAARFFRGAYNDGFTKAAYYLGRLYENGDTVMQSFKKAFQFYSIGASDEDTLSLYRLGWFYDFGLYPEINGKLALTYYNMAARKGHGGALCMAGYHALNGNSSCRNWPKAVRLFKAARKAGEFRANMHLAYCYENGVSVEKDTKLAFLLLQEAYEQDCALSPFHFARCFEFGIGVQTNMQRAAALYLEARNDPSLGTTYQSYYGLCLIRGLGVRQDVIRGLSLVRSGLKNGHGCGWSVYGDCFRHGYGVPRNIEKAAKCYSKAISSHSGARGVADSHFALAQMYESGLELEQNSRKAAHHYVCAADRMNRVSQWKAGLLLESGIGVDVHIYRAFFYFDLAARSGYVPAQCKAGEMFMKGIGVQRDRSKAVYILTEDAGQGDQKVRKLLQ